MRLVSQPRTVCREGNASRLLRTDSQRAADQFGGSLPVSRSGAPDWSGDQGQRIAEVDVHADQAQ